MDYFNSKRLIELSGINPDFGIPHSFPPRFPPSRFFQGLGTMDQKRLKEKFFQNKGSVNTQLQDFNQMYQKFASGLFEMAYPQIPPGHPLFSRLQTTESLKNENAMLRSENLELKKQLEKNQKPKYKA